MRQLLFDTETAITPNPGGQQRFAEDWRHFIVAAEGGWYSGKSFIGARKLVTLHAFNAFDREGNPTYVASFVVAPTYGNAMDFCVPHLQDACDEAGLNYRWRGLGPLAGGRYFGPAIVLTDLGTRRQPSIILIRSAEITKRITGFTAGAAWGDEPARWKTDRLNPMNDPFVQMLGRVRAPKARKLQILFTYTNEGDTTKIYNEMHSGMPDRALYRIPTLENPIARDFHERQFVNLTPELAEQYLDGKAAALRGGKVYYRFDENLHVDSRVHLRKGLPIQISLDFNRVPGVHLEVGQHHPDADLLTVVYEIFEPRLTTERAAQLFVALVKELKWQFNNEPVEVYGDATGRTEWTGTGQSDYVILAQQLREQKIPYRIRVPKANPHVVDRVNAFNVALQDMLGEVHYKIHPRCKRLIEDLRQLQSDEFGGIDKTDKKLSHPSDAEGYRVSYIRPVRIEYEGIGGRVSWN